MRTIIKTVKFILSITPGKYHLKLLFILLLQFLNSILELAGLGAFLPIFSLLLEDDVINKNDWLMKIYNFFSLTDENQLILIFSIAIFFLVLIKNIISLWVIKYNASFSLGLFKELTLKLHRSYYRKGFMFFKSHNSNILVRNLQGATREFAQLQVLGTLNLINEMIILFFIVGFIMFYDYQVLIFLLVLVGPPFYFFYRWVRKRSIILGNEYQKILPKIWKEVFQTIFGFVDITITQSQNKFRNKIRQSLDKMVNINIRTVLYNLLPSKVIETSLMFGLVVVIFYGVYFLPSKSDIIKLLGLFALAGYRITPSINRMMIAINGLNKSLWIIDVLQPSIINDVDENKINEQSISFLNKIHLEGISYKYPGGKDYIFKELDLVINKGEVIGLVGPSGAGKTTLMNILLGFLIPSEGKYYIDDIQLSENNKDAFYKKVGYVQQSIFIIDGTLAENIAFGCTTEEIDFNKLQNVIEKSSLTNLVEKLPNGINEKVGENGSKLSGGQKQRVGIARALYFDSEILFLDEATSALDDITEKEITESIQNLADGELTIIIIAHRVSTLENCNRIINIEANAISEI